MDWQSENALLYSARYERRQLAWRRASEVLPHLPFLVRDNQTIGRDIVLVGDAARRITAAYGPLFPFDPRTVFRPGMAEHAADDPSRHTVCAGAPRAERPTSISTRTTSTLRSRRWRDRRLHDEARAQFQIWAGLAGEQCGVPRVGSALQEDVLDPRRSVPGSNGIVAAVRDLPPGRIRSRPTRARARADHRTRRQPRLVRT